MAVDHHKVIDVAWFPPSRRRHDFVRGKVYRMQNVTKKLVALNREKTKVTIEHPLQLGRVAAAFHKNGVKAQFAPEPLQGKAMLLQDGAILLGGKGDAFLAVMEKINVAGKARGVQFRGVLPAT
jgi:hypothetical protein